jgi:hypothetical protein
MISRSPALLSTGSIHEKMTISQRLRKHRERQMFWLALSPEMALAREAGFKEVQHVSAATLRQRYFTGRSDGLRLGDSEALLVATT